MMLKLPEPKLFELHAKRVPVLVRMLGCVPARGRKLVRLASRFAPPALPFNLNLMPLELLLALHKPAPQMPLNPLRELFGLGARPLLMPLSQT